MGSDKMAGTCIVYERCHCDQVVHAPSYDVGMLPFLVTLDASQQALAIRATCV
jgi:hypothetical protein